MSKCERLDIRHCDYRSRDGRCNRAGVWGSERACKKKYGDDKIIVVAKSVFEYGLGVTTNKMPRLSKND